MNKISPFAERCPSDLVLDRYHASECAPEESQVIAEHLEQCGACRARMQERQLGFAAFGGTEQAYLARFRNAMDAQVASSPSAPTPWWSRFRQWGPRLVAGAATVACVGLLVSKLPVDSGMDAGSQARVQEKVSGADAAVQKPGLRSKGTAGLTVFVSRQDQVHRLTDDEELFEGDKLRFSVTLDRVQHIMIVGQEASGDLYPLVTAGSNNSLELLAGSEQVMPDSVQLDESTGKEAIHLVRCDQSFHLTELAFDEQGALEAPEDCVASSLRFTKSSNRPGS